MGNSNKADVKPLRDHVIRTENDKAGRSAVVIGCTGATGKFILSYLICSSEWTKITIIHRREVDLDDISKKTGVEFTEQQKSKVTQHVVDMNKLCENEDTINKNAELFKGHDITFNTLGTKRAIAKTAEAFRQVDLYMVRDSAILSKKAGVKHFSLCSSAGASAGIWANDWKVTHGLLYLKTKGQAENAVIEQKINRVSIFRPGFLNRDGNSSGLSVRTLAAVMVYDAECGDIDDDKPRIYDGSLIDSMSAVSVKNYDGVCVGGGVGDMKENDDNDDEVKEEAKKEDNNKNDDKNEGKTKEEQSKTDAPNEKEPKVEEPTQEEPKDADNKEVNVEKENTKEDDKNEEEIVDKPVDDKDEEDYVKVEDVNKEKEETVADEQ